MSAAPLIVAESLTRRYRAVAVVEDVDLTVPAGHVLGLVGPNGGGKSTLLLLLAGLVRPSSGTVTVQGVPAHELARARTGRVGLITAQAGLYPLLTGRENLHFFGGLFGLSSEEVDAKAGPLLEELELGTAIAERVGAYSSGMQQKLSLVRALLLQPAVLLLDEPTANLDPVSAHTLYEVVRRRADDGITAVIATHDLVAAEGLCDEVVVLDRRVRAVERFEGARAAPAPGRLLALLQAEEHP